MKTPNPVLIMPANIRFQEISSLIDFMYHGEVAIPTEDVNQFLAVAEQFKVRSSQGWQKPVYFKNTTHLETLSFFSIWFLYFFLSNF